MLPGPDGRRLRVGGADSGSSRHRLWGCAAGPEQRGHDARIRTPPHDREQWAERPEQRKSRTMLGPAGDSALSSVPSAPSRPGSPAAALSLLPSPAFMARAAERWPPTSLRLAAFLLAGRLPRVREGAARASRIGRARGRGRARNQRAHRQPGARRSPRTSCRSGEFSVETGAAARLTVRYGSWPGRRSFQPSWPASRLGPHQKASEGQRPRLPPGLWPPAGGHPGARLWSWKRK